ncbi:MAG: hypothetical protein AVDCRST_MAG38-2653 [uncultured Solirubrobacteraceae bacterium]|uniref:DUF1440 domain-containing protein n=1 Tax=uncultured Solirubrobacteraceae bacterium TaxID=1162706 RepID=A0A6J4S752_9ACTN|nr:MAG: hypothetical protein AVDCRST_MAG38-2653 [uncultured Solirubrobacteraceae bacterium]
MVGQSFGTTSAAAGTARAVATGALAGAAGTVVMTAFQRLVEMPLTGRRESYEPANMVQRLTGWQPRSPRHRRRLNYAAHFGVGAGWGAAHGAISGLTGLRGQRAVAAVFGLLWPADVLGVAALGVHEPPWRWTATETAVDFADKLVLAQATGLLFDRVTRSRPD